MTAAAFEPETAQVVCTVLALAAAIGAVLVGSAWALAGRARWAHALGSRVARWRNPITLALAGVTTAGSLYFSEVAHYVPCRLCWFQRVAMYPIAVVALVATVRRDPAGRWYASVLAAIGAPISGYHYLIEWRPELDSGSCSLSGPACTDIWFRTWGFATLAFMALCGFAAILAVNLSPGAAPTGRAGSAAPAVLGDSLRSPARPPGSVEQCGGAAPTGRAGSAAPAVLGDSLRSPARPPGSVEQRGGAAPTGRAGSAAPAVLGDSLRSPARPPQPLENR